MATRNSYCSWPGEGRLLLEEHQRIAPARYLARGTKGKEVGVVEIPLGCEYVINYNVEHDFYCVWNGFIHACFQETVRGHHYPALLNYGAAFERAFDTFNDNSIVPVAKYVSYRDWTSYTEILVFVGRNALANFFERSQEYFLPGAPQFGPMDKPLVYGSYETGFLCTESPMEFRTWIDERINAGHTLIERYRQ